MGKARREEAAAGLGAHEFHAPSFSATIEATLSRNGEIMSTALATWRRHRVDYRWPTLAALVLSAVLMALLPRMWRLLDYRETREGQTDRSLAPYFVQDEGLQLIDPRLISGAAHSKTPASEAELVQSSPRAEVQPKEALEGGGGEYDFAWDPTRGYRLSDELIKPREPPAPRPEGSIPMSFGSLLQSGRLPAIAPRDSASVVATLNFAKLQRQIFLKNAPFWDSQKATERARELYLRMIMSNPLRGPQ